MSVASEAKTKAAAEHWYRQCHVLHDRIRRTLALHTTARHSANVARPRCTECGFPWPCETVLILNPPTDKVAA